jgi:RNase P subunit RPR2
MADLYWFAVTVRFLCPACHRTSAELMSVSSPNLNVDAITQKVNREKWICQICKAPLIDGVEVSVNVQQSTPDQLRKMGLHIPADT